MKAFFPCVMLAVLVGTVQGSASIEEDSVSVETDASTRKVTVSYELKGAERAVVTFDVLTNGTSVGGINLKRVLGSVYRIVEAGKRTFVWCPDTTLASNVNLGTATVKVEAWDLDNPPAYMVCDLVTGSRRYYPSADALPGEGGVTNEMYKTDFMVMRKIPAKGVQWRMGRLESEPYIISKTAATQHYVKFASDYYIGVYEFTYGQMKRVKDEEPALATAWLQPYPMTNQSWIAIRGTYWNGATPVSTSHIGCLRSRTGGIEFDLPTDEQWEYACRAGTATPFANGTTNDSDHEMGWYKENSGGHTHPVGLKKPNAWGLYDMHGNVWEHCLDAWYEPDGSSVNASLHSDGGSNAQKVAHGGCFGHSAKDYARSACRINRNYNGSADQGFRVACPAVAK